MFRHVNFTAAEINKWYHMIKKKEKTLLKAEQVPIKIRTVRVTRKFYIANFLLWMTHYMKYSWEYFLSILVIIF